jgi:hypothetical protein
MSVPVAIERLREAMADFDTTSFLLTVSDDSRPHAVAVQIEWSRDDLVTTAGKRSVANASARSAVSVIWGPASLGGYSLIVDADATVEPAVGEDGATIRLTPTKAVLHRTASAASKPDPASTCSSDCIPLTA